MSANTKKRRQGAHRQPAKNRLSVHARKVTTRKPRVARLRLPLTLHSEIVISLRRFKTNKARRSKLKKQLVFQIGLLSFKEIAIAKSRRKKSSKKASVQGLRWLRARAAVIALVILGLSGSLYFGLNLSGPARLDPVVSAKPLVNQATAEPVETKAPVTLPRSEPTRVRLSRLNIDASLVSVGLKLDGSMEIPSTYGSAGWYKLAPTPGELGPAIIVGHVDSPRGPAVFWRLRETQPGDIVEIDRADSKTVKFKVDTVEQVPSNYLPVQQIFGDINHAGIRLMTCGGTFDIHKQQYDKNVVVFGTLIY